MQGNTPCNIWQLIIQSSNQDIIGAPNKPLNNHYKFNWRILEEPLDPVHEKLS